MTVLVVVLVCGAALVATFVWAEHARRARMAAEIRAARDAYERGLSALTSDPTNAGLKRATLALGREYSDLARSRRGVTLYDEVVLANDLGAACAGATEAGRVRLTAEERLTQLVHLRGTGMVTADEFQAQRARILGEL